MIKAYKGTVEDELDKICTDILTLLDSYLIANAGADVESSVFYKKVRKNSPDGRAPPRGPSPRASMRPACRVRPHGCTGALTATAAR